VACRGEADTSLSLAYLHMAFLTSHGIVPETHINRVAAQPGPMVSRIIHTKFVQKKNLLPCTCVTKIIQAVERRDDSLADGRPSSAISVRSSNFCQARYGPQDRILACNQPHFAGSRPYSPLPPTTSVSTWPFWASRVCATLSSFSKWQAFSDNRDCLFSHQDAPHMTWAKLCPATTRSYLL